MKIAAICCTYKRPKELATAIECFLRQDYPAELRELVVLDDAGQYENQTGDGWRIVSLPFRFRTLGEKRNASAGLVSADVDAYCVWDDDDIYLPWHMTAAAAALADADYTIPTVIYNDKRNRLQRKSNQYLFHGAWAFRRTAFEQVGGYPFIQSGQDQGLLRRFKAAKLRRADPIQHDPRPSYVYRWFTSHSTHISAMGTDGYERLGQSAAERIAKIEPRWDVDWLGLANAELKETQT
ncbi:MAG: glycosyltransferase family A protein [Pirellulaceae bacterium]